jgi:peptidoglycan/xylan/chitin deacetylase (PgdA/CDA1 family)
MRRILHNRMSQFIFLMLLISLLGGCAGAPVLPAASPAATRNFTPPTSSPSPKPLLSPSPTLAPAATPTVLPTLGNTAEPLAPAAYCLWPGDTLSWVARQAGVSLAALQKANPDASGFAGSTIHLPPGSIPPENWTSAPPAVKGIDDIPSSDSGIYIGANNRQKRVALTFDVGYEPQNQAMIEWLAAQGIHATFFVVGESVAKHPEMIHTILDNGHSLGNHSWDHPNLQRLAEDEILSQLVRTEKAVQAADRAATTKPLFRAPFGAINDAVISVARYAGYHIIGWTVDSHDWMEAIDAETVYQRVTQNVCPGAIVEMHDANPANTAALPRVVAFLKRNGYEIVDLKSLLFP